MLLCASTTAEPRHQPKPLLKVVISMRDLHPSVAHSFQARFVHLRYSCPPTHLSTTFLSLFNLHRWFPCSSRWLRIGTSSIPSKLDLFVYALPSTNALLYLLHRPLCSPSLVFAPPPDVHASPTCHHTLARVFHALGNVPFPHRAFHLCCCSLGFLFHSCYFFCFVWDLISLIYFGFILLWKLLYQEILTVPFPPSTATRWLFLLQSKGLDRVEEHY